MMDNKLSELKRRADKCPIKRFKAFIGKANTQATLCADTGIEIIGWSGFDASDLNAKSHRVELARFIAAADPETILALLAELEAKDKRIGELEAIATEYAGKFQKAQDAAKHLIIMNDEDKKRISELESEGKVWESAALKHLARAEEAEKRLPILEQDKLRLNEIINSETNRADEAEKRLATPVRLPALLHPESDAVNGMIFANGRNEAIAECSVAIRQAGFLSEASPMTVEGDDA